MLFTHALKLRTCVQETSQISRSAYAFRGGAAVNLFAVFCSGVSVFLPVAIMALSKVRPLCFRRALEIAISWSHAESCQSFQHVYLR